MAPPSVTADDEYCCFVSALAVERRMDGAKDREAALAIVGTTIYCFCAKCDFYARKGILQKNEGR